MPVFSVCITEFPKLFRVLRFVAMLIYKHTHTYKFFTHSPEVMTFTHVQSTQPAVQHIEECTAYLKIKDEDTSLCLQRTAEGLSVPRTENHKQLPQ